MSAEAAQVRASAATIVEHVESSGALFGDKTAVLSAFWNLVRSHAQSGWDGGEALPIDRPAVALAMLFIRALPDQCGMPEVGVDPDGAVTLDWMLSRHRMLSISFVGSSDRLAYAWVDGTDGGHAVEKFDRDLIPPRLLQAVLAITETSGHAALRVA